LGLFPNSQLDAALEQNRAETYAALLKESGHSVSLKENIQIAKWEKVICNILWNPISALTKQNMGVPFFQSSEEAEALGKALMLDVIAVGRESGVPLDDSLADKYIAFTKSLGSFEPSMLHDLKAGIPLELDVIIGTPMRKARQLGMEVPSLTAVYVLVTALNGGLTMSRA
jgi:ketopantoate reductase